VLRRAEYEESDSVVDRADPKYAELIYDLGEWADEITTSSCNSRTLGSGIVMGCCDVERTRRTVVQFEFVSYVYGTAYSHEDRMTATQIQTVSIGKSLSVSSGGGFV